MQGSRGKVVSVWLALVAMLALVVAACGGDDEKPAAPAPGAQATTAPATATAAPAKLAKIRVALPTPPSAGNMWFTLAQAQGWDKEFGIELDLQRATGGGAATALVVGGGAEIAGGVPDSLLNAVAQGEDLVSIWKLHPQTSKAAVFGVIARKDAGIASWKDLKGKTVGILGPASATKFSTDLMLFDNGLKPDDVTYVTLGGTGAYLEAMKAKRVDAVGSWHDPNETIFKRDAIWSSTVWLPATKYEGDIYLAKRSWVEKNEELAIKFNMMLAKAMAFYINYPEQALDIGRAAVPEIGAGDRAAQLNTILVNAPTRQLTGTQYPDDLKAYVPLSVQAGLVKGLDPAKVDVDKVFTNKYVAEAMKRLYPKVS